VIGQVLVPTADRGSDPLGRRRSNAAPVLVVGLVAAMLAWPAVSFSVSPTDHATPALVAVPAPQISAFVPPPGTPRWVRAQRLLSEPDRVAAVGSSILAVTSGGMWPVSLLRDDGWHRLLGVPPGYRFGDEVAVTRSDGFAVVGTMGDRTVVLDYRPDGRFAGTTTVPNVIPGAVTVLRGEVVVFDAVEPHGVLVSLRQHSISTPGRVVDAGATDGWLLVLLENGTVHATADAGSEWSQVGDGFRALLVTDTVVAVGGSVSVGLQRFEPTIGLVPIARAPFGPAATWGGGVAIHDWSTEGVWWSTGKGWERLPLWSRHGFTDTFVELVDGAAVPTVLAIGSDGEAAVWQIRP
jgi:hypothetical protein